MQLIGEMLDNTTKAFPDQTAMVYEGAEWAYRDLNRRINRLTAGLKKLGIAKYKAPRMVEFVDSLPQGPTGKILKRELRASILNRR